MLDAIGGTIILAQQGYTVHSACQRCPAVKTEHKLQLNRAEKEFIALSIEEENEAQRDQYMKDLETKLCAKP